MTQLLGIKKRHALCKICNCFNEDLLNQITLDILLHRRTYQEIRDYYTPLLPAGVAVINDVNINNHRKHSDTSLLAQKTLDELGEPTTEAEMVSCLYGERYKEEVDRLFVLKEVYRERINNLSTLQILLNDKRTEYLGVKFSKDVLLQAKKKTLQKEIRGLIKDIDEIQSDLQSILLRDIGIDKGLPANDGVIINNTSITNNLQVIQLPLQSFLADIIPYLMISVFSEDEVTGKAVVKRIQTSLDKQFEHLLKPSTEVEVVDA